MSLHGELVNDISANMLKIDGMTCTAVETDMHEYFEAYQKMIEETKMLDDFLDEECSPRRYDDGEEETEWLHAAGLGELTEPWNAGREVQADELGTALRSLSKIQAEAVEKRVRSLNRTVKQRFIQRTRAPKPDIRDVFKDTEVSSTGTRSRSATPDSLDSILSMTPGSVSPSSPLDISAAVDSQRQSIDTPSFVSIFHRIPSADEDTIRRLSSVSATTQTELPIVAPLPQPIPEIFRRTGHWSQRGDVANDSDGIKLTGYQQFGSIHLSGPGIQRRSDSGPSEAASTSNLNGEPLNKLSTGKDSIVRISPGNRTTVSRSHSSLHGAPKQSQEVLIMHPLNRTSSYGRLSFEDMCQTSKTTLQSWNDDILTKDDCYACEGVEMLSQRDLLLLQPLLWLELSAIFDKHNLPLVKRKPNKRRKKAENLFGVSLSTLLLRDSQLTSDESNVPIIFQKLLYELIRRGVHEEGILRIGGHKQKVEALCLALETDFYLKPKKMDSLFERIPCHDLTAVLKKLVRDLPQPLFTIELIDAFYQVHGIKNDSDVTYALNLLMLLLPVEHRSTLHALLNFLRIVIKNQSINKMSIHNVAMIVAPSLFPPRYIYPRDRSDLSAQINLAAVCCRITETLLTNAEKLWHVPRNLVAQLRRQSQEERYRKYKKKYY